MKMKVLLIKPLPYHENYHFNQRNPVGTVFSVQQTQKNMWYLKETIKYARYPVLKYEQHCFKVIEP